MSYTLWVSRIFSEVHDAFMPQVKQELLSVIRQGHVLMQRASHAAVDDNTDPSLYDGEEVTEAIRVLSVKFAEKSEEAEQGGQQNETLSESNVGLHACAFADGAACFAKLCEGLSGQRAGQDLFSDRVTNCKNRMTWSSILTPKPTVMLGCSLQPTVHRCSCRDALKKRIQLSTPAPCGRYLWIPSALWHSCRLATSLSR